MPKSDIAIDNKLIKKHYPNTNNDQELSFIFESDPNLCLLKNKIAIHMIIELDESYIPDNGFAAKQFSSISVELNSQKISNNKTNGEYWMNDWITKYGNLNPDYVTSVYEIEGYFDKYGAFEDLTDDAKNQIVAHRRNNVPVKDQKYVYELNHSIHAFFYKKNLLIL